MKYMLLVYSEEKVLTDSKRQECYAESIELTHRGKRITGVEMPDLELRSTLSRLDCDQSRRGVHTRLVGCGRRKVHPKHAARDGRPRLPQRQSPAPATAPRCRLADRAIWNRFWLRDGHRGRVHRTPERPQ